MMCEKTGYQFFTEKEPSLITILNISSFSQMWEKNVFNITRDELVSGNITLTVGEFNTSEPVVMTRKALPVNGIYIFDFTLSEKEYRQTFDENTVYNKKKSEYCGISTSTVQMIQMNNPGHRFYKVELFVYRSFLIHFINQLSLNDKSEWNSVIENNTDFFHILNLSLDEIKLVHQLVDMYTERKPAKKIARILSVNLVHEILAKLLHRLFQKNEENNDKIRKPDFNKIIEVRKVMESRLNSKYSLEEVSHYCNMSPTKFKFLFKSIVGLSFSDYYTKIRMQEAVKHLEGPNPMSISQLSVQLGYKNPSQFTRAFREYFHYPPTDFLKPPMHSQLDLPHITIHEPM